MDHQSKALKNDKNSVKESFLNMNGHPVGTIHLKTFSPVIHTYVYVTLGLREKGGGEIVTEWIFGDRGSALVLNLL